MKKVQSASKSFHVIPVTQDMVYNFADHSKYFFLSVPKERETSVSSYRVLKYTKGLNGVECSSSARMSWFTHFVMLKNNAIPNFNFISKAYHCKLSVKHLKCENVMLLANEYVGKNEMYFYHSLKSDKNTGQPADSDATE